jgi:hypothetical protein
MVDETLARPHAPSIAASDGVSGISIHELSSSRHDTGEL